MTNVQRKLWYIRRDGRIRGPFPTGQVHEYMLLGRLSNADEVSLDGELWRPVPEVPELIPGVLRHQETEKDRQKLLLARIHADERSGRDRRDADTQVPAQGRRSGRDRRAPEPEEIARSRKHRLLPTRWYMLRGRDYVAPSVAIAALVALIAIIAASIEPGGVDSAPQCDASPKSGVNWNNCHLAHLRVIRGDLRRAQMREAILTGATLRSTKLKGSDLSYADLSHADLRYSDLTKAHLVGATLRDANLSYATLQGANLTAANLSGAVVTGARLSGVILDHAIWLDDRLCGPDSRGRCRPSVRVTDQQRRSTERGR